MLAQKKIIVGVCGGIAAYKSAMLIRLLVKNGAEVKVLMTPAAKDFISPLTLATLSKNPVKEVFFSAADGAWNNHVELGLWADVFVIAPATANTLAKMANGLCDNLLLATYLSAKCPVMFAPAMDLDMHQHPTTKRNIQTLVGFGNRLIPSESGELASGLYGEGRMAEPETIYKAIVEFFASSQKLKGQKVLITAGPTYEAIDPVRFIGNHSSGKMGIALAEKAASMGADVTLVCGPSQLASNSSIKRINVTTSDEMFKIVDAHFSESDICIMAAAVADYKPETAATEKIKKKAESLNLELVKTVDILGAISKSKKKGQILVGFALETQNELDYAIGKLEKKNLDLVVMNSLKTEGAGFGHNTNKVMLITKSKVPETTELLTKNEVAEIILEKVLTLQHT